MSEDNAIYHNNFFGNILQVYGMGLGNVWDNGYPSGGNYWSDYNGTGSNEDGIGDIQYVFNGNNQDNYPLMGMFSDLNATSRYRVTTICNF